jgi:hypothetical protein
VIVSLGDAELPEAEKDLIARCVENHLLAHVPQFEAQSTNFFG